MKKRYKRHLYFILAILLSFSVVEPISATTISELQKDVEKNKKQLKDAERQASEAQEAQEGVGEEIEELDAELVSLITDINLIEEAISRKEEEIAATQVDYDDAVAEKDEQYAAMKIRIQFMYEKGDSSYLNMFLAPPIWAIWSIRRSMWRTCTITIEGCLLNTRRLCRECRSCGIRWRRISQSLRLHGQS